MEGTDDTEVGEAVEGDEAERAQRRRMVRDQRDRCRRCGAPTPARDRRQRTAERHSPPGIQRCLLVLRSPRPYSASVRYTTFIQACPIQSTERSLYPATARVRIVPVGARVVVTTRVKQPQNGITELRGYRRSCHRTSMCDSLGADAILSWRESPQSNAGGLVGGAQLIHGFSDRLAVRCPVSAVRCVRIPLAPIRERSTGSPAHPLVDENCRQHEVTVERRHHVVPVEISPVEPRVVQRPDGLHGLSRDDLNGNLRSLNVPMPMWKIPSGYLFVSASTSSGQAGVRNTI
jgi:hypothetical protein